MVAPGVVAAAAVVAAGVMIIIIITTRVVSAMAAMIVILAHRMMLATFAMLGMLFPHADAALVQLGAAVGDRARTGRVMTAPVALACVGTLARRTGADQPQAGDGGKQKQLLHERPPQTRRR